MAVGSLNLGDVVATFRADTADFQRGLKQVQNGVKDTASQFQFSMQKIGDSMSTAGKKATLFISTPMALFGLSAIKAAADQEQLAIAFETMLGSAERAKVLLEEIAHFAATTPFELPEVQSSAKALIAFGISAEEVIPKLKGIGDVASGVGIPLQDLAVIYGKAKTAGRLFAEDINQLTERGVPIIAELAEQFGVAESEVRKLVESGQINFSNLETAFASMSGEGGQFFDLMQKQSESTAGQWSNLQDSLYKLRVSFGDLLLPEVNKFIDAISSLINWLNSLDEDTKETIVKFIELAIAIPPTVWILGEFIEKSAILITTLKRLAPLLLSTGGLFVFVGAMLVVMVALWVKNWDKIKSGMIAIWEYPLKPMMNWIVDETKSVLDRVSTYWNVFKTVVSVVWTFISNHISNKFATIKWVFDSFMLVIDSLIELIKSLGGVASSVFDSLGNAANSLKDALSNEWNGIKEKFFAPFTKAIDSLKEKMTGAGISAGIGTLADLVFRAQGGPVSSGMPYIVGEQGPELFVPNGSGQIIPNHAGVTVNMYDTRVGDSQDIRALGREFGFRASLSPQMK